MMEFLVQYAGYITIFLLFLLMLLGVPVFIAMAMSALLGSFLIQDPMLVFRTFIQNTWQSAGIFELVALPLFIYTGTLMQQTESSRDLFAVTKAWVGSVSNSLGVATVLACGIFSAITGSSIATAATIGLVAIPLLLEEGYGERRSAGFVAGGGTLGIIIPPSIPLILYGVITETSIGRLFIAGVVPGAIMLSLFALYVYLSRPAVRVDRNVAWDEVWRATRAGLGVLFLPVLIIVAIYTGVFTPTEVGALAVLYVIGLGVVQRRLNWNKVWTATRVAMTTTGMLYMLIVFGQYFAHFLSFEYVPQDIASAIVEHAGGGVAAVTLMILTYVVLGMFIESAAMLLISIPIFFPVAMDVGMDPITFGIFACIAMEVAQISPPIGVNLFTIHGISRIRLWTIAKGAAPFLLIQLVMLYVVYYWPQLTLWLPSTM